ncbi:25265_t:CDS:2 [Gigaspora margarita]|uniref:25265_t:CDS:1 n=1 Tax=Gigaspora margarita TaxID=4874 RepID=A0ABN7UR24_GIGMA|nr:25265_t:CDS:2 [Gigaspora margarita]
MSAKIHNSPKFIPNPKYLCLPGNVWIGISQHKVSKMDKGHHIKVIM